MIRRAPSRGLATPIALALLFSLLIGVDAAHAAITIAWDPSPDATVIGYRVYVGTSSGVYTQVFNAGNTTSFSYYATEVRTYYFAVAAYAPGTKIGPLSSEVSATVGTLPNDSSASYWSSLWQVRAEATRLTRQSRAAVCWEPVSSDCVTVQTIALADAPVSSLAATGDGRLFFVEGGRRVRLVTRVGLATQSLVVGPNPSIALNQVAVDPTFAKTGFIWVSETETRADGRREFRIARYRVVQNRAGERAAMIPPIALPESGEALFTIDPSRNIYVALPASQEERDVYGGTVLRFAADGTVPLDNRLGSAIFAAGYARPTGIHVDSAMGTLWLSGFDSLERASTASVDVRLAEPSPRVILGGARAAVSVAPGADGAYFLSLTSDGQVERRRLVLLDVLMPPQALRLAGRPLAMTAPATGETYVAVQIPVTAPTSTFAILRLSLIR